MPYEEAYKEYLELEKEIKTEDTFTMTTIIYNREWMWT